MNRSINLAFPATSLIVFVLVCLLSGGAIQSAAADDTSGGPVDEPIYSDLFAQNATQSSVQSQLQGVNGNGFLARIALNSPKELEKAFLRANALFDDGKIQSSDKPISFVIHGPEVQIFFKDNYQQYKSIVDLAAKLSAFNVVDVNVCLTRMGQLKEEPSVLPPFVGTVPFGPAEVERLIEDEEYVYF